MSDQVSIVRVRQINILRGVLSDRVLVEGERVLVERRACACEACEGERDRTGRVVVDVTRALDDLSDPESTLDATDPQDVIDLVLVAGDLEAELGEAVLQAVAN